MGSKSIETGTRFYVAFHDGLSYPVDAFLEWRVANTTAWKGLLEASGVIAVDKPNLLGGDKDQGGVVGSLVVMFGEADQVPQPYLVSKFGNQTAAWRGFLTVAYAGGQYGANNPYSQKRSYRFRRIMKGWDDDICWYPEKAEVASQVLRSADRDWRYLVVDKDDATAREAIGYDDSAWAIGRPPFASHAWDLPGDYGFDTEPATLVPVAKKVWMRTTVFLDTVPATMRFQAFVDNDCKFYVNGQLVTTVGGNNGAYYDVPISTDAFQRGDNVIAVEGWDRHTSEYPSNFFWFDWRLESTLELKAMNPAHILYFLRTSRERGREPTANMADANMRAAADYWADKGFGLCGTRKAATVSPAEYEAHICEILDCNFSRSVTDGQFYIDRSDGDYDLNTLPVLTDDDVLSFKEIPTALDNAVNSVSVKYFDPILKKEIVSPAVRALGLIAVYGEIHQTYEYPEVPTATMANEIAFRKLVRSVTPTRKFELDCTSAVADWRRFQYFRLQLPKRGIADMVCLVGSKVEGKLKSGGVQLTAAQDSFSVDITSYVGIEHGVDTRPSQTPVAITEQVAFEAPYFQAVTRLSRADLAALPDDVGYLVAAAVDPAQSRDFTLVASVDGVDYDEVASGDFCPAATVVEADALYETGTAPATGFTLTDAALLEIVQVGEAALWGAEWCRVDALDLDVDPVTISLGRGCADTVPQPHAAGERLIFCGENFAGDATEYSDGETIHAKLLTNTGSDQLEEASATALDVVFDQRLVRPYPPGNVLLNDEPYPAEVFGNLQVTFAPRDRELQADQLVDFSVAGVGPELGTTYTLEIYDTDTETIAYSESGITVTPAEIPAVSIPNHARLELYAVRDGLESWQRFKTTFVAGLVMTGGLPGGALQETYSQQLVVANATEPVTWSVSVGALPAGLTLGSSTTNTVSIDGIPTATGYSTFNVKAVDADGRIKETTFTVGIGTIATLLHMNGAAGSTTFTDETGRVWTRGGNTVISTTQSKFGGASAFFDGNADSLTTPYTSDWNFNAGDWAIDFYAYMTAASGGSQFGTMFSKRNGGADCDLIIYNSGQTLNVKYGDSGNANKNMGCGTFLLNTLYRVTVGRKGTKLYCAVDGVIRNSVTITGSLLNRALAPELGKSQSYTDAYFKGYIDEFKYILGAALFADDQPGFQAAESDYPAP